MRRLRWFDPDTGDSSKSIDWRVASTLLAGCFFNFVFANTYGAFPRPLPPLALYPVALGAIAIVVTAFFFLGPALAARERGRPLLSLIVDSFGSFPAFGLRLCLLVYLTAWMALLLGFPLWLWANNVARQISTTQLGLVAALIMAYLLVTAKQRIQTVALLARFTNKLGIAVLLAALIRVREGWPFLLVAQEERGLDIELLWFTLAHLSSFAAPVAFAAAEFGHRCESSRSVVLTGLFGVALPLFTVMLLTGVIRGATFSSPLYQPSLDATVAMALWSKAARSAMPGRILVAAVTTFGAVRIGSRLLAQTASFQLPGIRLPGWLVPAGFVTAIGWASVHLFSNATTALMDWSCRGLGIAASVITRTTWLEGAAATRCAGSTGLVWPPWWPVCRRRRTCPMTVGTSRPIVGATCGCGLLA